MLNTIYMNSSTFYKQCLVYIFFTSTLFLGLYLGEDTAGGAIYDYNIHLRTIDKVFSNGLRFGLLNYDNFENSHSPIFIVILNYLTLNNELIGRLVYLFISSLIVLVFYQVLILKYKNNFFGLFILSNFFLLSPYFRSYSIWPGDETISLIFLCISIYFYFRFVKSEKNSFLFLLSNVLSLAIACYLRPIYCIFSIYFLYSFFINDKFNKRFFIVYFISNIVLAFPAFYYVFILDVNFFASYLGGFNIVNTFTLFYLTIFFYLIPFILLDIKNIFYRFNLINFISSLIISLLVIFFFNYEMSSGGGFFLKVSEFLFKNHLLVYLIFPVAFYYSNQILEIHKVKNLILFLLLIFIEIDGYFFMESYDPLFYVLFLTLFDLDINKNLDFNLNKRIIFIFIFQIFLIFSKIYQLNFINDFKLI